VRPLVISSFAFVVGACLGSFAATVAYRLPRGLSLLWPGSFCPTCQKSLPWWCNIPVFSYVFLRGRCFMCQASIPARDFVAEVALGVAGLYLSLSFPIWDALARLLLDSALMAISLIDLEWRIVPDVLSLPGIVWGAFCATFLMPEIGFRQSILGALVGSGFLYALAKGYVLVRKREGLGLGDVKLMGMIGAYLGLPGALFTIFFGALLGSAGGIALALLTTARTEMAAEGSHGAAAQDDSASSSVSLLTMSVPFAPFLSLAAAVYAAFQPQLVGWFLENHG